jgi:TctA family transporter
MDTIAELFPNLFLGFSVALSLENLAYCFIGVFVGTVIGVLPGIGPLAAIAMLLPLTFKLNPVAALIMLSGIYYGTKYGGSTTAIMLKLPGESASVVTCLDGYEMAKQGRAGPALGMAAVASFIAGSIGTVLIGMFGPPLAEVALLFGAPEFFSLMLFSLIGAAVLVHGSMLKALGMIVLGLLLGIVGTDVNSGMSRFTFGVTGLSDGISFVVIAMGLFGFAEIVSNLEQSSLSRDLLFQKVKNLWPSWQDFKRSWNR